MSASFCARGHKVAMIFRIIQNFNTRLTFPQISRSYARGIRRTPVAVRTLKDDPEKLKAAVQSQQDPWQTFAFAEPSHHDDDDHDQRNNKIKKNNGPVSRQSRHDANLPIKQQKRETGKTKSFIPPGNVSSSRKVNSELQFQKLEEGDKRFGSVLMTATSRKEREKKGLILLEGRRLIKEALCAGVELKYLYFSDISLASSLPRELLGDAQLYKLQYRQLKMWADTQTPAGILGICTKPPTGKILCLQEDTLPMTLICDNVRDPNNMGTIIRTAAAAGCQKIITTKGCVDVWNPKVLRGGMGGHFHTCILDDLPWEQIVNHIPPESYLCIADTRKASAVQKSCQASNSQLQDLLDCDVETDIHTSSEMLEDIRKPAGESEDNPELNGYKSNETTEKNEWSTSQCEQYKHAPLSVIEYSDMDCSQAEEITVIVGGETEGVSNQAKKLCFENYGQYVTIPMAQAVDSLNVAVAAAVIMYEIRRQLSSQLHKHARGEPVKS